VGKIGPFVWDATKRPFVETWKFLSHPFAGLQSMGENLLKQATDAATSLAQKIVVWSGIALASVLGFAIAVAMGLAALILRRRRSSSASSPGPT
jgi:hypothetical protein